MEVYVIEGDVRIEEFDDGNGYDLVEPSALDADSLFDAAEEGFSALKKKASEEDWVNEVERYESPAEVPYELPNHTSWDEEPNLGYPDEDAGVWRQIISVTE